jgi:crotonobetainyl-CoA:carnitine CoA-transferase CaiB-like acyl-CoA transferase
MPEDILADITVVDMTEGVAGPFTSMQLADMGARVIKVERRAGDWNRGTGTSRVGTLGSAQFLALNQNKRDLGVDAESPGGREIMQRLVAAADVIVSNYRPGVMQRLGLGYGDCRALEPAIVYCTISGFGQDGPYAALPASDTILQAMGGIMQTVGEADGPPLRVGFPLIDLTAANHAVQAILLALYRRLKGGGGAEIDISLMNAALSLLRGSFADYMASGRLPSRQGNQNTSLAPAGAFQVAGGRWITIAVLREEHWAKFCAAMGLAHLVDDPRFRSNAQRLANRAELDATIAPLLASGTAEHWLGRLRSADVLCGPINTYADIIADPTLADRLPIVDPGVPGVTGVLGNPIRLDGAYFPCRLPPPAKGQHTREILAELGFNATQTEAFLASGAAFMAGD